MVDAALFIGWGQVVRGREKRAVQVFNESVEYWGGLQGDGKIEDFEVVLLTPHGGDLQGFALLRGSEEQVAALQTDEEFQRRVTRADQIIESQGVVTAAIGEGIARGMAQFRARSTTWTRRAGGSIPTGIGPIESHVPRTNGSKTRFP